jgi:hypothetical protein
VLTSAEVNVNSVSALVDSDDDCWLNAIDAVSEKSISVVEANVDKKVTALMNVNDCEVRFQLDNQLHLTNSHHHYQRVLKRSSH